jgi:hypothetical protein
VNINEITAEIETLKSSGEELDRTRLIELLNEITALPTRGAPDQKARVLLEIARRVASPTEFESLRVRFLYALLRHQRAAAGPGRALQ